MSRFIFVVVNFNYLIAPRTAGANPFKIFNAIRTVNAAQLEQALRRMDYDAFLQTAYWFAVSSVVKSNARMRCQVCNESDGLTAHHRTYDTHGREHENLCDLVALCRGCHGLFHGHLPPRPPRPVIVEQPVQIVERVEKIKRTKEHKTPGKPKVVPHEPVDSEMPDGDQIILTRAMISKTRANGSFTNSTLNALGVSKAEMTAGWPGRLVGKSLSRQQYWKALEGRFIYKEKRLNVSSDGQPF